MGKDEVARLRETALTDPDDEARYQALIAIAKLSGADGCKVFLAALEDDYRPARVMAARGLGAYAESDAVVALRAARDRDSVFWRWVYSGAIRKIERRPR